MELSTRHRQFFRNDQFLHAFVINVIINGAIAWAILREHEVIPLWGESAMGPDLLATGVLLPVFMTLIVSRIITGQVAKGDLPPLDTTMITERGMHRRPVIVRAGLLALFATFCGSLPLVALLHLASAQPVSLGGFVTFKALWAGAMAALLSPPMAWWALATASENAPANAKA
ncbi:MAG: hypothetical protein CL931_07975 [Deltaproteobacteria bacterium]|nr:hypothetical protein [Deltaproteobacteria bacterium]